jgi:hypothetical protein
VARLNLTLPHWFAAGSAILALAAWSLSMGHALPQWNAWEQTALLFFGSLSGGIFAFSPSIVLPKASSLTNSKDPPP